MYNEHLYTAEGLSMHKKIPFFEKGNTVSSKKTDVPKTGAAMRSSNTAETMKAEFLPGNQAGGLYPKPRLAQAYVIWQTYGPVFSPSEALEKGTLFPELYSPYPY